MQDGFDPYHKWLGIPSREQPPHHYRLLALPLFESDPEVIESAADQRMGHVRTYQAGRYSALSQQILNELATARVCLLSPEKKQSYDTELQARLNLAPPQVAPPAQNGGSILPSPPPPIQGGLLREPIAPAAPIASAAPVATGIDSLPAGGALAYLADQNPCVGEPAVASSGVAQTPAPIVAPGPSRPQRSKNFPLVVSTLGVILLLFACAVFLLFYLGQTAVDAPPSDPALGAPGSIPEVESFEPLISEPLELAVEPLTEPSFTDPTDPVVSTESEPSLMEETGPDETGAAAASGMVEEAPADPEYERAPSLANILAEAAGEEGTTETTADPDLTESPTEAAMDEKWHIPKRSVAIRVEQRLQPIIGAAMDCNGLLALAEQPDRPSPEVYVLLMAARLKAMAAHNAADALLVIDVAENKFYGDEKKFRNMRVTALAGIGNQLLAQQAGAREFRDLAIVAQQASEGAQTDGNKPLAREYGTIALNAAQQARDTSLIDTLTEHLKQLR